MNTVAPPSEPVISVQGLHKAYRLYDSQLHRLADRLTLGRIGRHRDFAALREINLEVHRGETVGIIGRNGSGKSTLLQVICGVSKPTSGTVSVAGRISALLELGAGFHPELTGMENIFLHGTIQGITRQEMTERVDEILAFADIGDYIHQPVKLYSSGMFVRLAFAVAVSVEPDILVVDEAMAVGDAQFQKRCFARIRELRNRGVTLLFVSHDQELVRILTDRALVLDRGQQLFFGNTREASHLYRKMLFEEEAGHWATRLPNASQPQELTVDAKNNAYGIGGARIQNVRLLSTEGDPRVMFLPGETLRVEVSMLADANLDQLNVGVVIRTVQGVKVYSWGTFNQDMAVWAGSSTAQVFWEKTFRAGEETVVTLLLECTLGEGSYEIQAVVSKELDKTYGTQQVLHWRDEAAFFKVKTESSRFFGGICNMHGQALFE